MNSKVIGAMLILGPILLIGPWLLLSVDTQDKSPSDSIALILAETNKVEIGSMLNIFGVMSMFAGLYFLARSLKSDNTVSNTCSEIGGLLLLLCLPIWVLMMGTEISAIDAAKKFGDDVGATILATSKVLQMSGIMLVVGVLLLGIALTLLRKYKGIVGILFIITSSIAFISMVASLDGIGIIGWMGMFITMFVTGILTTLQKENQA